MSLPILDNWWAEQLTEYDYGESVLRLGNGKRYAIQKRDAAQRIYSLTYRPGEIDRTMIIHDLFAATRGGVGHFLIRDAYDHVLEDEPIAVAGDESPPEDTFVLIKTYGSEYDDPLVREIRHFDHDSLVIKVDGVEASVSEVTEDGEVVLATPPSMGQVVTASVDPFYVRCALTSRLSIRMTAEWRKQYASVETITCEEVL